jgi:hypothetical protein
MSDLIDEYFRVCERVGFDDFGHPRLEALRNRMSRAQVASVALRLRREGEQTMRKAAALETFAKARRGEAANDNKA